VAAQVAEQATGRRVVGHSAGLADLLGVGLSQRGGAGQAGQQDPHLAGVQGRGCLITALQRVEDLDTHQVG